MTQYYLHANKHILDSKVFRQVLADHGITVISEIDSSFGGDLDPFTRITLDTTLLCVEDPGADPALADKVVMLTVQTELVSHCLAPDHPQYKYTIIKKEVR